MLCRTSGFCEAAGNLDNAAESLERGQGTIGQVFQTGVPQLSDDAAGEPAGVGAAAVAAGLTSMVALPILREGRLLAVVAWFF